jgi:pyruvate, orthophosphate dikinase
MRADSSSRPAPPPTGALGVNLARTAVEVVIPEEHAALVGIVAPWTGVQDGAAALLRELYHEYVGWPSALADLHRRAMSDFSYYNSAPRGAEAVVIFCDLYTKVVSQATSDAVRDDALRYYIAYLQRIVDDSGEQRVRNTAALDRGVNRLRRLVADDPHHASLASGPLRRLAASLVAASTPETRLVCEHAVALTRQVLAVVYDDWLTRDDPSGWFRAAASLGDAPLPAAVTTITHPYLRALRGQLGSAAPGVIVTLPDAAELARTYLAAARLVATPLGRLNWLLRVLRQPALAPVHERALREVSHTCSELLRAGSDQPARLVRTVFALLRDGEFPYPQTVLDLVGRIGRDVLATGDPELAEVLIDEVLAVDFHYPDFQGFTSEWGVRVDPAHIANIRTYLGIIDVDPLAARPLIVALAVHLAVGGVFIADTDLFQRDVSALLASPISSVYLEVKQLLKLIPAYFSEIGAEGELRDVSTRLDEIAGRRDPLCHFLRKQSHVECNPRLVAFADEIIRFWATGSREGLRGFVPAELYDELAVHEPAWQGPRDLCRALADQVGVDALVAFSADGLAASLADRPLGAAADRDKLELLYRVRREIARKYRIDHADVITRLRGFLLTDQTLVDRLDSALAGGHHETALREALTMLERLRTQILSDAPTSAVEDIYRKRHIAVGIPSLYGTYREPRFDALGLSFRLESLATALFESVIEDAETDVTSHAYLTRVARWLRLLLRAVRIDGYRAQGLTHCLSMLDEALRTPGIDLAEYHNVFQLLSRNIESLVRARIIDTYSGPAQQLIIRMVERGVVTVEADADTREAALMTSEVFLRDRIASSFGLQRLDTLCGRVLHALHEQANAPNEQPAAPATGEREPIFVPFMAGAPRGGIISLGNKGFMLRRLHEYGFQVPPGFVITTTAFRDRGRLERDPAARAAFRDDVRAHVRRIEQETGAQIGDPRRPLLLSVRGGAPLSMPGLLASFLNVGINPRVAEGVAARPGRAWAAWDADRRFVQLWGMSQGIERHRFDELMRTAKHRHGVAKKAFLAPDQMRELAASYRDLLTSEQIMIAEDPYDQILACIGLVWRSWDSPGARAYRQELQIAEGWGTAVVIQAMVFGNLDERSGTGVLLTRHPNRGSGAIELYGDVVIQAQGDDVVSGLVDTMAVSERQRRSEASGVETSLETSFPAIYTALSGIALSLIDQHGMNHQEIEFTFESDRAEDLYVLQARDAVIAATSVVAAFITTPTLDAARIATGIGVSGGALSGRAVHTADEISRVRARYPDEPVILLRPDTVPDDIPLVLRCDGLLTAIGGATSHAAVAAKRLEKTCVVSCRPFSVHAAAGHSQFGDRVVNAGEAISINGLDGAVYVGAHATTEVRVRGRAQQ